MTYSCSDFTDSILDALGIDLPEESWEDPSAQADMALEEIERLQRLAGVWKKPETKKTPRRSYEVTLYATNDTVLAEGVFPARNRLHALLCALSKLTNRLDVNRVRITQTTRLIREAA